MDRDAKQERKSKSKIKIRKDMKIPFDISKRPQIESGEYKVETRDGLSVRIICWDRVAKEGTDDDLNICVLVPEDNGEAVYYYHQSGKKWVPDERFDLYIITPEPELSEFEERIFKLLRQYKECDTPLTPENIKAEASMLWSDLEKYFFDLYGRDGEGDSALRSFYYRGLADGKVEALKDLPRWRHAFTTCSEGNGMRKNPEYSYYSPKDKAFIVLLENSNEAKCLMLDDLKKLPGFKED